MALTGKTISQLPELTAITTNTVFVVEQLGNTYNIKNLLFQNTYFPLSGGTVTGSTNFTGGLSVNTISATTYQNLPTFSGGSITGLTVNGNLTVTGNTSLQALTATTISATTYSNLPSFSGGSITGLTVNGNLTVTGNTSLNALTATTISATTYSNLPVDPDTYVTGFTYGSNVFTLKQNNGQPDLTALINSVTGWTVNGNLTVTGNTSVQGLTATTINSGTVTVTDTSGTPSQAASFDSTGKLVAGLGQTTYKLYGNASLPLSNASSSYFVVPGLSQTFTVPSNCSVYVFSTGGIGNTNGSNYTFTSYVGIFVDGSLQTDGGFNHINTMNPSTINAAFTNTTWSLSSILNLSAGSHTVDIRARYVNTSNAAQGATVSGISGNSRQGELYIMIIKN